MSAKAKLFGMGEKNLAITRMSDTLWDCLLCQKAKREGFMAAALVEEAISILSARI